VTKVLHALGRGWRSALTDVVLLVDILAAGQFWVDNQSLVMAHKDNREVLRGWGA